MPPLTDEQTETIREIQRKVRAMLDERRTSIPANAVTRPSHYWTDFCSFFDYMIDLPPRSFANLRLHTYHLTGDNYLTYYGNRQPFLDYWGPWLATEGIPAEHRLSEPEGGIGFRLDDGRLISQDIARFQRSVSALSRLGLLDSLVRNGRTPQVVEIGAGYGGLALQITRILGRCRYVIVDLPETLLFAAAYLALNAPEKRILLYEPGANGSAEDFADADFVLIPDYRLEVLAGSEFDLAINIASMQEMRVEQVERYLDFLRTNCRGAFYSCNQDCQIRNQELPGLFDLIRTRFEMTEILPAAGLPTPWKSRLRRRVRNSLRQAGRVVGLFEPGEDAPAVPVAYVEHLCRARSAEGEGVRHSPAVAQPSV